MTTESQTGEPLSVVKKDRSLAFRGFYEVITKPAQFFEEIRTQPKVLVPLLAVLALCVVFFILAKDVIYNTQMATPEAQQRLQGMTLTPGVIQMIKIQTVVMGTIAIGLVAPIAAALAYFWGNFVFAGKSTFKHLLSVAVYGEWIAVIGMMISLPIMLAKEALMAPFSLGVLAADQGIDSLAYLTLSKFDVFNIWEIVVMGIGLSVVYAVPRKRGYVLSLLSVGMLSFLHVAITGIWKLMS